MPVLDATIQKNARIRHYDTVLTTGADVDSLMMHECILILKPAAIQLEEWSRDHSTKLDGRCFENQDAFMHHQKGVSRSIRSTVRPITGTDSLFPIICVTADGGQGIGESTKSGTRRKSLLAGTHARPSETPF